MLVNELITILNNLDKDMPIRICTDEDENEYNIGIDIGVADIQINNFGEITGE